MRRRHSIPDASLDAGLDASLTSDRGTNYNLQHLETWHQLQLVTDDKGYPSISSRTCPTHWGKTRPRAQSFTGWQGRSARTPSRGKTHLHYRPESAFPEVLQLLELRPVPAAAFSYAALHGRTVDPRISSMLPVVHPVVVGLAELVLFGWFRRGWPFQSRSQKGGVTIQQEEENVIPRCLLEISP